MVKLSDFRSHAFLLFALLLFSVIILASGCISSPSSSCKPAGNCDPKLCPENCPIATKQAVSEDTNSVTFELGDDVRIREDGVCLLYEQQLNTSADLRDGYVIVPDAFGHLLKGPQVIDGNYYWYDSDWTNFGQTFGYFGWVNQNCFIKINLIE